jgi:hypothetical protein
VKSSHLFGFIVAILFALSSWATDFLFVLHNLGETNGLKPVMQKLPEGSHEILAFGKAWDTLKDGPCTLKVADELQTLDPRASISDGALEALKPILRESKVVITGMASVGQAQILNETHGTKVIFYDNFDPMHSEATGIKEYIQPFYETLKEGRFHLLVPGTAYEEGAKKLPKFSNATIHPLGQPSLESWEEIYARINYDNLKCALSLHAQNRVLLFAGGFDPVDETQYKEDLESFLKGAAVLDNVSVLVTFHPKTDGSIERDLVRRFCAEKACLIEKGTHTTAELSTIANVVVCFKSTVGAQAAYMEKPVLYVAQGYKNFLTEAGIALLATNTEEVTSKLAVLLTGKQSSASFTDTLGIPKDASNAIGQKLTKFLE